jgi:hypothetical protein
LPAGRFLAALAEHEIAERGGRRLERHLAQARLPPGKTLDTFDFEAVPVVSKAQVMALAAGDAWLNNGANLLLFGPPGGGKSHLAAAVFRTQAGPGDEMPRGREAAHIVADLGHDDPGTEVTDPRDRGQDGNRRAKGLDIGVDLPIDLRNRRVDGIDLLEVQLQ